MVEYSIVTIPANENAVISEFKNLKQLKGDINVDLEDSREGEGRDKSCEGCDSECDDCKDGDSQGPEQGTEGTESKKAKVDIKVIKKSSRIQKVSSLEEVEQKKLQALYVKMWGV